ncbi:HK97 family phage prohead protease [Methyloceanibacter methanicus]|uniref:HK97 family phage prohead protease n=1 Tax=Methyloceanibacter methanicus TaxID=1774968 RepID=UPI000849DE3D|nr:HK97 family phage prohead protease [Methyloceanibacter methanicus]
MNYEGGAIGTLECREDGGAGLRLHGRFPYNKTAILSDGGRTGRPKKERFGPKAFNYRVAAPGKEIHLLVGHNFGKPLASKLTDTLIFLDTAEALEFDALIAPAIAATSYGRDIIAMIMSGLAFGISPGFRIPPKRAVAVPVTTEIETVRRPISGEPVTIEDEPNDGTLDENGDPRYGAIIRLIWEALLYEISIVTRPAYKESQVEMRDWTATETHLRDAPDAGVQRVLNRWRA